MTKEGNRNEEIDNKIIQGRKAIGKLNSVLWNEKITLQTKKITFFHNSRKYSCIWIRNMGNKQEK
jgi:hypothetical protein